MNIKAFRAKQHFDQIKMLGGLSLSKRSGRDFFDKLRRAGLLARPALIAAIFKVLQDGAAF
ncbi:MAG: hypothetical protein ACI3VD_10425 [Candidatus Limivicinus sp.]